MKVKRHVILGHAVGSETGGHEGKPGNQNGKELRFQEWYDRSAGWTTVLRAKNAEKRTLIALNSVKAVNNKNVGYGQPDRTTFYREANNHHWAIEEIDTPCNTDCSAKVSVCVNASGIKVSKDIYTGNMVDALLATKEFKAYTSEKYLHSSEFLMVGDILVGPGHTAIVTSIWIEHIFARSLKFVKGNLMRGDDVELLQNKLNELGFDSGKADGIFGIKTEDAVKKFQSSKGLKADGIAGRNTIKALGFTFE